MDIRKHQKVTLQQSVRCNLPTVNCWSSAEELYIYVPQVLNGLERHLIPSLFEAPLDVDGLRLYVILPEYEMFQAAQRYKTLAVPLAKKLLSLHPSHQKIIGQYCMQLSQ